MDVIIRQYTEDDLPEMLEIWNAVVEEGDAFPQEEPLDAQTGASFFASQSRTAVAVDADSGKVLGLYILHPNNVGRCGHICNTSYAVSVHSRGMRVGERLVRDSLVRGRELGFKILQFNAVVATNHRARRLYESLGFTSLGTIPGGFRMKDGRYEDICPYYIEL